MPPTQMAFLQAFWAVWQTLAAQVDDALREGHGLDLRSFIALAYIQGAATPPQPSELAQLTGVPRYEMSRILARLDTQGLITRQGAPGDARRVTVTATPAGHHHYAQAEQTVLTVTARPLAPLGEGAVTQLTHALNQVAHAARPPGAPHDH